MEIKVLYVVELENGEKHYFATRTDRNYYLNKLRIYDSITAKRYEIKLEEENALNQKGKKDNVL